MISTRERPALKVRLEAGGRGVTFEAAPGETLLAAALRQRIAFPYECATGTCGTCRARVVGGAVEDGWAAAPGRKTLAANSNEVLACQAHANSDCALQLPGVLAEWPRGAAAPAPALARISALRPLTHDMLAMTLGVVQPFEFQAGQFALLRATGVSGWRAYSMTNAQSGARQLDFVIKRKPDGGFTDWLFDKAQPGDALELFGPLGRAVFEPELAHDLLLVVGGSGLAVALSILGRAEADGYLARHRVRLFFGVRGMRDACYLDLFSQWRTQHGKAVRVTVALSDQAPSAEEQARWPKLRFDRGMVHDVVARDVANGIGDDAMAFLAGPPAMVDATVRTLFMKLRMPPSRIRYDKFS